MAHVNLGGRVTNEENVYIGSNAPIYPKNRIGRNSKTGSGCIVCSNIQPNSLLKAQTAKNISHVNKKKNDE